MPLILGFLGETSTHTRSPQTYRLHNFFGEHIMLVRGVLLIFAVERYELLECIAAVAGKFLYIDGGTFSFTQDGETNYDYGILD